MDCPKTGVAMIKVATPANKYLRAFVASRDITDFSKCD
jgi:hypothetical protein